MKASTSVGENVEKVEPPYIAPGSVKYFSCCGKQFGSSSKGKIQSYRLTQQFHSHLPEKIENIHSHTCLCMNVHSSVIQNSAKPETIQGPSTDE